MLSAKGAFCCIASKQRKAKSLKEVRFFLACRLVEIRDSLEKRVVAVGNYSSRRASQLKESKRKVQMEVLKTLTKYGPAAKGALEAVLPLSSDDKDPELQALAVLAKEALEKKEDEGDG